MLPAKPRAVYYWASERMIPFRKAGRFTIFDRDEIIEWTRADEGEKTKAVISFSR